MITFLSEEQLMLQAGISPMHEEWETTRGVLQKLEKLEMIHNDNGVITINNWQKRQETKLTSYERVKRYREKKRDDNAMITLEENRIDKKRIDNTNTAIKNGSEPRNTGNRASGNISDLLEKTRGQLKAKGVL